MKSAYQYLGTILNVDSSLLEHLDKSMTRLIGKNNILEKVAAENEKIIDRTLKTLDSETRSTIHILSVLRKTIFSHEKQLLDFFEIVEGVNEFEKAALLSRKIAKVGKGFFLKKEFAEQILRKRVPTNLLKYLKAKTIDEVLQHHDVLEVFSTLRFIESNEWMHQTFEEAYANFTANDFEAREIEIKVLGPIWQDIAIKFVAKKHHNVSHLKEFGVIFLNPIKEDIPGKFLRDFALLLHYFHEVDFYSKLFQQYISHPDFTSRFKMLLRGDVPEIFKPQDGEWLIVQRYLTKENYKDPRLSLPRVNPESLHWSRGERDLTMFQSQDAKFDLRIWNNLDWVGGIFQDGQEDVVSFDLEDNAMSLVSFMEGKEVIFNYHQREAMWTKIFMEYAGGEEKMEKLLLDNFYTGSIRFNKIES
ncbi:MAG TPA: hypothetical protein VJH70_00440 [Candidatus Paceibacterota bacterium]